MTTSLFGVGASINANVAGTIIPQSFTGIAGQTLFNITAFTYTPATNSLLVFINGQKQISGKDFAETSSSSFTLVEAVLAGDVVEIIGFPVVTLVSGSAAAITYNPGFTGAVTRPVQTRLTDTTSIEDAGGAGDGITNNSTAIAAEVAAGKTLRFQRGNYLFGTRILWDYTSLAFPGDSFIGTPPVVRFSLQGESQGTTALGWTGGNTPATVMTGPPAVNGQGYFGKSFLKDFNIYDSRRNIGGNGSFNNVALSGSILNNWEYRSIVVNYFYVGEQWDGILSSFWENCRYEYNTFGAEFSSTGAFLNNANTFVSMDYVANNQLGRFDNSMGACNTFMGVRVEANGQQGGSFNGGWSTVISTASGGAIISITGGYFEGNAGDFDLDIENPTGLDATVILINCTFNRVSSARYTIENIRGISTGGAKLFIQLQNCSFLSAGTYVPSAARPFIVVDPNTRLGGLETCVFSETTSLTQKFHWGQVSTGRVNSNGVAISLPSGITSSKTATGTYVVTSTLPFGINAFRYFVVANGSLAGGADCSCVCDVTSATSFTVYTRIAGVLADHEFAYMVAAH